MTMLQKLENTYLAILRFTVILIAGLLLLCAAFFMMNGLPALMAAPSADIKTPQITVDDISVHMVDDEPKKTSGSKASVTSSSSSAASPKSENADEGHLEKIASVIFKFIREKSGGTVELDANYVKEIIRKAATDQDSPELAAAYLKNLADSVEQILNSAQVKTMLQTPNNKSTVGTDSADPNEQNAAVRIINKLLMQYRTKFDASVIAQRSANTRAIARHANAQANAQISLYAAIGCFAIFILVVFMSIFIKIERNLRPQAI